MLRASKVASRVLGPAVAGLFVSLASGYLACKGDAPPPPLSSAPAPIPPPSPSVIQPEDERTAPDPSASSDKRGPPAPSFTKCCYALLQNALLAPEPNKTYLMAAGNACTSMVAAGQSGPRILGALPSLLHGAGLPTACSN